MTTFTRHAWGCDNGCRGINSGSNRPCPCQCHDETIQPLVVPTDEDVAAQMRQVIHEGTELGHVGADGLLCDLLFRLGYTKTVSAYHEVPKWYA